MVIYLLDVVYIMDLNSPAPHTEIPLLHRSVSCRFGPSGVHLCQVCFCVHPTQSLLSCLVALTWLSLDFGTFRLLFLQIFFLFFYLLFYKEFLNDPNVFRILHSLNGVEYALLGPRVVHEPWHFPEAARRTQLTFSLSVVLVW